MPKTATKRKMSWAEYQALNKRLQEAERAKQSPLARVLGYNELKGGLLRDFGSGVNDVVGRGAIAQGLGAFGDIGGLVENTVRGAMGKPQVIPYGGSEHIGQKLQDWGLVSPERRPMTELAAGLISPSAAAKSVLNAPKTARGLLQMASNWQAPNRLAMIGRPAAQRGAIENLWHGSPHTFDRFDLSKIGTGEGAQAYGHGAYLAESPDVAKGYQETLAGRWDKVALRGEALADQNGDVANALRSYHQNPTNFTAWKKEVSGRMRSAAVNGPGKGRPDRAKELTDAADTIASLKKADINNKGNLYQTRLAWPDAREATDPLSPDHFLHWDKPLSEQGVSVRSALRGVNPDELSWLKHAINDNAKGNGIYDSARLDFASSPIDDTETSRRLNQLGIPGIRYLDSGSRGAGAGSHNYVVFDDKLIDIVSRNGQPVGKMAAPQDEALRVAQANAAKPVSEGGLGLRPDNTPEERAAAMGFTTDAYHGTRANFDAFDINRHGEATDDGWYGKGFYFAPNPEVASGYAMIDMKNAPLNVSPTPKAQGSVMPVKLRLNEPYVTDRQLAGHVVDDLRGKGYDSIIAADYTYDPISKANEIVTFDPRNIRSRFAAFDPMRRDSSDLLAGLAPFGAVPWLWGEQQKKRKAKKD